LAVEDCVDVRMEDEQVVATRRMHPTQKPLQLGNKPFPCLEKVGVTTFFSPFL